jgi:hypothetical protein
VFSGRVSNVLVDQSLGLEQIATESNFTWSVSTYNNVFKKRNRHRYKSGKTFETRFEDGPLLPRIRARFSRTRTHMKDVSHFNERCIGAIYTYDAPKERANKLLSADVN